MYKLSCKWIDDDPAGEIEAEGSSIAKAVSKLIDEMDEAWALEGTASLEVLCVAIAECLAMFDGDDDVTHTYRDPSSDDAVIELHLSKIAKT